MADLQGTIKPAAEVALVGATPKTVLMLTAPANHRAKILGWSVGFDGTVAGNEPVVVELVRYTTSGTFTSVTPKPCDDDLTETFQSTGGANASAEPTASDIIAVKEVHPQTAYEVLYPFGQEIKVKGSGRVGIRCTAPQAVNCFPEIRFEE